MKLVDWLEEQVIKDPRALAWFDEEGSDQRIAEAFKELLSGYAVDPKNILKTTRKLLPDERPGLVEVKEIAYHSICAHHFLPFFGHVDLAYVPGDRILGLGKLPRLVDAYARRFQIQEDLVRGRRTDDDGGGTRPRRSRPCARTAPLHVQPRPLEPVVDHPHGILAWHSCRVARPCESSLSGSPSQSCSLPRSGPRRTTRCDSRVAGRRSPRTASRN